MVWRGIKKGKNYKCAMCGKIFYRGPYNVKNTNPDRPKFCSRECLNVYQVGKNNPFYGKKHSEETKKKVSKSRKGKCLGNKNALGYKHTDIARKKISEASKKLWKNHKNKMIESLPRGAEHSNWKPPETRTTRKCFTPYQQRTWKNSNCAYCHGTKNLVLDHIIPLFDGGKHKRDNIQTLCQPCNLWKLYNVDLPRYHAALALKGD